MFLPGSLSRRHRLRSMEHYSRLVMGYEPIAYWPLDEQSGTTAHCLVSANQNGTYSSDVSSMGSGPGIGDGRGAAYFDAANDYVNIYTATFDGAFDGATGSMAIWCKVSGSGVYTDGLLRLAMCIYDDAQNYYYMGKDSVNNQLNYTGEAGDGYQGFGYGATPTAWFHMALTWSDSAGDDEITAYYNGTKSGPAAGLDAWAGGGLDNTKTTLGASSTVPADPWSGWLAHAAVWDRVLTQAEVSALARV